MTATLKVGFTKSLGDTEKYQIIDIYWKFKLTLPQILISFQSS